MSDIVSLIKSPVSAVFRRAKIKRRDLTTGLFESSWVEVTDYVKKFGKIKNDVDSVRINTFSFANVKLIFNNEGGKFNEHTDEASLWYGYLNQQRTLVKIEAGFVSYTRVSGGPTVRSETPAPSYWDEAVWDTSYTWDNEQNSTVFVGIISGDIDFSDKNEVAINVKPLMSIFQDYPARNLVDWTTTGMTASRFVQMVRDHTDGSANFIFRPFFENTTSYWDISTTSNVYANLNTSTANGVYDKSVWDVITKLAEAENFVPYVDRYGVFKFVSRAATTATSLYEFHGAGVPDSQYGITIKAVTNFGRKMSKYYSRVQVKYLEANTATSTYVREATMTVSGASAAWTLGVRTYSLENLFIPSEAVAQTIANTIFNDYSSLKREVTFKTSFVPHLTLFDRVSIYYDPAEPSPNSLWDQNDWASDSTNTSTDLIFDSSRGDGLVLYGQEFKFLSIELDLDNLENTFIAREA